jgi:hypothetical protein
MSNKQKFVHYVMVTFTYSIGVGTAGAIVFALITSINDKL